MRSPTSAESSSIAADGCAEHALAPFDGQVRPRQQLDVRAVRGQRRPQLVRGVRDQLLLSLLRLVEGCEHRVEVGCEACQLVPAAHRDPPVEVTRRAHLAHRPGERTHRAQHRIRGQSSEQARRERPAERQAEQQPADAGDRRVRLGQRAHGPHQPVARRRQSHRVQPHRRADEANVPEVRGRQPRSPPIRRGRRICPRGLGCERRRVRRGPRRSGRRHRRSGRRQPCHSSTAPRLGMTWKKPDASLPNERAAFECHFRARRPLRGHALCGLDQREVDLVVQLRAHLDVDHQRCDRERDEHGAAPGERQARTQAHGSRSA